MAANLDAAGLDDEHVRVLIALRQDELAHLGVPDHCGRVTSLPGRGEPLQRGPRDPTSCLEGHDATPALHPTIAIKCAPPYVVRNAFIVPAMISKSRSAAKIMAMPPTSHR